MGNKQGTIRDPEQKLKIFKKLFSGALDLIYVEDVLRVQDLNYSPGKKRAKELERAPNYLAIRWIGAMVLEIMDEEGNKNKVLKFIKTLESCLKKIKTNRLPNIWELHDYFKVNKLKFEVKNLKKEEGKVAKPPPKGINLIEAYLSDSKADLDISWEPRTNPLKCATCELLRTGGKKDIIDAMMAAEEVEKNPDKKKGLRNSINKAIYGDSVKSIYIAPYVETIAQSVVPMATNELVDLKKRYIAIIPDGVYPGHNFNVILKGQPIIFTCPQGVGPGDEVIILRSLHQDGKRGEAPSIGPKDGGRKRTKSLFKKTKRKGYRGKSKRKTNKAKGYTPVAIKTMYKKTRKRVSNTLKTKTKLSRTKRKEISSLRHSPSILRVRKRYQNYKKKKTRRPSKLRFNSTAQTLAEIQASKVRNSPDIINPGTSHWENWNHVSKKMQVKPSPKKRKTFKIKVKKSRWGSFKKSIKKKFKKKSYGSK